MDFLLVIVETFSLGVTDEALRAKTAFSKEPGQFSPQFQVQGVIPTNHSFCQILDKLTFYMVYGIGVSAVDYSFRQIFRIGTVRYAERL